MKKAIYIIMMLCSVNAFSQAVKPANYISFSIGSSKPFGKYAATNNLATDGFASRGGVVRLEFGKYKSFFGWCGMISVATQKMNTNAFNTRMANDNVTATLNDSSKWMSSTAMGGFAYGKSIGRWTFEGRLMGGFFFAKNPSLRVNDENKLPNDYWKYNNIQWNCVGALGWQTAVNIRYKACKHWYYKLTTALYGSTQHYKMTQKVSPENGQPIDHNFKQKTTVLDFSFGLGYNW